MNTPEFNNDPNRDEGWLVVRTSGTNDIGDWRIERIDHRSVFQKDDAAWTHVIDMAVFKGSEHHKAALRFIRDHNETEWVLIENHAGAMGFNRLGALIKPNTKAWALAVCADGEIEVSLHKTEEDAQNAFMRDLYEIGQDYDLPDVYDTDKITDFLANEIGDVWIWKIEEVSA